jgi:hypothetical protein
MRRPLINVGRRWKLIANVSDGRRTARPLASPIRHRIDPLDVPPTKAARRLHLTLAQFHNKLTELRSRGFPPPDPTTGNYYLPAIDRWMADRFKPAAESSNADCDIISERIARL